MELGMFYIKLNCHLKLKARIEGNHQGSFSCLSRKSLLPKLQPSQQPIYLQKREEMQRSRPALKALMYDVVIVGGGPIGSAIAYHCALKQLGRIAVIERDKTYQSCSAMLSAGGIRQQFSVPENIKMSKYGAEFLKNMDKLALDGEVPDINFRQNGYLFLAGNEEGKNVLQRNNSIQKSCGVEWIDLMSTRELGEKFPWLNTEGIEVGSFSNKNEGYFDPWGFILAMKKKAMALGVTYIDGDVVGARMFSEAPSSVFISSLHVKPSKTTENVLRTENIRTDSMYTTSPPTFEVTSGTYVNAAGAWAGKLVELLKKETQRPAALATLPVVPRKRCIFNVHCPRPQQEIQEPVPCPARVAHTASRSGTGTAGGREGDRRWEEKEKEKEGNEDRNGGDRRRDQSHCSSSSLSPYPSPHRDSPLVVSPKGVYFRPEGAGGKFITGISPSENQDPDCEDSALHTVDHNLFEEQIWPQLAELVPAFEELRVTSAWAGFYDYNTLDQNAIIGHHPEIKNLVLCNGFSGHGLQQSPAAGLAVAEIISSSGKFETLDLSRFSFERVLLNKPIFENGIV